jgi:hypothetical protein
MKILIIFTIGLLAISATAQLTDNQRIGAYSMPTGGAGIDIIPIQNDGECRKIGNKTYLCKYLVVVSGDVSYKTSDGILILYAHGNDGISYQAKIALKNYDGDGVNGAKIKTYALQIGEYSGWNDTPLEYYDCGTKSTKDETLAAISAENKRQADEAAIEIARIEKARADAKAKADAQKKIAGERALKSNQGAAAKGDSYGLMRMGERYRDGDGVEKDLVKARDYFEKSFAADTNNFTAKEELSKLPSK